MIIITRRQGFCIPLLLLLTSLLDEKPELMNAFKELLPFASMWKTIGTLLGLRQDILDKVKSDEQSCNDRLQMMTSEWLKQVRPPPTWEKLVEAVVTVDERKGQEIKQRIATYKYI